MYKCNMCKCRFEEPLKWRTTYEEFYGVYELFSNHNSLELQVCPECKNEDIEEEIMREIIDLRNTNMTIDEIFELQDYVWKDYQLIPVELLGDK